MRMPARARIIARANDRRSDAVQQRDPVTARHYDTLIANLNRGAAFRWNDAGELVVDSANRPGAQYIVTQLACSCPCVWRCWHVLLRELLLDIFDTDATSADLNEERKTMNDEGSESHLQDSSFGLHRSSFVDADGPIVRLALRRPLGARCARARGPLFAAYDAETARLAAKGEMRAELELLRAKRATRA